MKIGHFLIILAIISIIVSGGTCLKLPNVPTLTINNHTHKINLSYKKHNLQHEASN